MRQALEMIPTIPRGRKLRKAVMHELGVRVYWPMCVGMAAVTTVGAATVEE